MPYSSTWKYNYLAEEFLKLHTFKLIQVEFILVFGAKPYGKILAAELAKYMLALAVDQYFQHTQHQCLDISFNPVWNFNLIFSSLSVALTPLKSMGVPHMGSLQDSRPYCVMPGYSQVASALTTSKRKNKSREYYRYYPYLSQGCFESVLVVLWDMDAMHVIVKMGMKHLLQVPLPLIPEYTTNEDEKHVSVECYTRNGVQQTCNKMVNSLSSYL